MTGPSQKPKKPALLENVPRGEYVGTLRWSPGLKLPKLEKSTVAKTGSLDSWQAFCNTRLRGTSLEVDNQIQLSAPHLIDALSFVLSYCWCIRRLVETEALPAQLLLRSPKLRIIAVGCTHRLEQRILQETNCFHELEHYFPHSEVKLCMVGPEMHVPKRKSSSKGSSKKSSKTIHSEWKKESDRFFWCLSKCTAKEFLKARPVGVDGETTIVIAYNSGMGSGDQKLQDSWSKDVAFLLDEDILCLFTCANDYMDVPGELKVMQGHRACFLMEPCSCPFGAMSVFVPEGDDKTLTTQANSFVYAVKGRN